MMSCERRVAPGDTNVGKAPHYPTDGPCNFPKLPGKGRRLDGAGYLEEVEGRARSLTEAIDEQMCAIESGAVKAADATKLLGGEWLGST
jgi:hypothetical protein